MVKIRGRGKVLNKQNRGYRLLFLTHANLNYFKFINIPYFERGSFWLTLTLKLKK